MSSQHQCSICGEPGIYSENPTQEPSNMCITGVRYNEQHEEVDNYHHYNNAECIAALKKALTRCRRSEADRDYWLSVR